MFKSVYQCAIYMDVKIRKVLSLEHPMSTMKYFGGVYALCIVTGFGCHFCMSWTVINFFFLFPLAYKTQRETIDNLCQLVKSNFTMALNTVNKFIPKYVETTIKEE
jgi:predicted secreted protein